MAEPSLLREARAAMFAGVGLSSSAALHGWAHGGSPAPAGIVAGAGLMLGLGVVLGNRRRGFVVIAVALAAAQAVLHVVFSVSTPEGHVMVAPQPPGAMLFAHIVAGVLIAGWLYAGETAVWRIARWLARRAPRLFFARLVVLPPAPRLTTARRAERHVPVPVPPCRRRIVRRGPPALSL